MLENIDELVFATHNKNKAQEIQQLLGSRFKINTLADIGVFEEIPETSNTIEGNAFLKSSFVFNSFKKNVFSDDTGLEVFSLNGAPGVGSARYAGDHKSNHDNISLLLRNLISVKDRSAQFRTVISLFINKKNYSFEGVIKGSISLEPMGVNGFGYDPIFIPDGYSHSFAEMPVETKNAISHRALAIQKLISFLES
jgi:XTP/dITP diphosphohydrolase